MNGMLCDGGSSVFYDISEHSSEKTVGSFVPENNLCACTL